MCEQFVKSSSDFEQFPRCLFLKDALSRLLEVDLPVEVHDCLISGQRILLDFASLQHEKSATKGKEFKFILTHSLKKFSTSSQIGRKNKNTKKRLG